MSSDYNNFDISSILTEAEQNELRSGTYTRTLEPVNEKMIHDSTAETVKRNTPSETGEVCLYPDYTVSKTGKVQLKSTFSNFKTMCRLQNIPVQLNIIRRTLAVPAEIRERHSLNGAEGAFCVDLQDCCTRAGIRTNAKQVQTWVKVLADANRVNPVREYLERQSEKHQIPEDERGKACMQVFDCLQFAADVTEEQRGKYANLFGKWLVQCVAMAHNENGKYGADFVLVLQSKRQGAGKTSFFRHLCSPKELLDYFLEGCSMDPSNKDDVLQNTSCWICELGELEGTTRKKEVDRLKAFLTSNKDRVRAPYDAAACDYPRLTCYAGTVNEPDFLREAGRRFVVLPIVGVELSQLKRLDIDAMWAEAYDAYKIAPNAFRLTEEERQDVVSDSDQFRSVSSEEQLIRDLLDWDSDPLDWEERTASEIARAIEVKDVRAVGRALSNSGYEKTNDINVPRRYRVLHGSRLYNVPALKFLSCEVREKGEVG